MDNISLDSQNPFLYVAVAAAISTSLNIYCCLRYCRNRKNTKNNRISNQEDIELTSEFTNNVLPRLPEEHEEQTATTTTSRLPPSTPAPTQETQETQTNYIENHIIDIETGATTTKKSLTNTTTQTEDCELYEMMGERFTQELEYYKTMNMKKK